MVSQRDKWTLLIICCVGVSMSFVGYLVMQRTYKTERVRERQVEAQLFVSKIEELMQSNLQHLNSIKAFYAASDYVTRDEFRMFTRVILKGNSSVKALEWIPYVPAEEVDTYEQLARDYGFEFFTITEKATSGELVPAANRSQYFPVFYVEPLKGNELALGYDLGSHPDRRGSLQSAVDSGELTATDTVTLIQEQIKGFLVFNPVYKVGASIQTPEERRENLIGFIAGVYGVEEMINLCLKFIDQKAFSLFVFDSAEADEENLIYATGEYSSSRQLDDYFHTSKISVAGRVWTIALSTDSIGPKVLPLQSVLTLLLGGLLTSIASSLVYVSARKSYISEQAIHKRTWELENINVERKAEQQKLETLLAESEETKSALLNVMDDLDVEREKLTYIQQRLILAAEAGQVGIWDWDVVENNLIWDERMYQLYGISGETFKGAYEAWEAGVHPDDLEHVRQGIQDALNGIADFDTEFRVVWPEDRSIHLIRAKAIVIRDADGKAVRMIGTNWDTTQEREMSRETQMILDNVPAYIFYKDYNNKILRLNQSSADVMGLPVNQIEGHQTEEFYDPGMAAKYLADDREVFESRKPKLGIVEELILKDGTRGWMKTDKIPIADDDGQFNKILVVATDITALKRAEEDLANSQRRLDLAVKGGGVGIWDWEDVRTGDLWWSERVYEILGFDRDEIDPTIEKFQELIFADDRKRVMEKFEAALKSDVAYDCKFRMMTKNSTHRWCQAQGEVIRNAANEPIRMTGTIVDIHDQELARQDLERSNTELEQFAYVASHDLQEPVRKIIGFTQLFEDKYEGAVDAEGQSYIKYIVDGANRMQTLIQDLLQYSRTGQQELHLERVNVADVAREAIFDLQDIIEKLDAEVHIGELPDIAIHRSMIRQLFQNLIGNSLKYHGDGKPRIEVEAQKNGRAWIFSIHDNGIGVDVEFAEQIFKIFQRLHGRTEYSGTGIGLALCRRIIEKHGGHIWLDCENESKVGATFKFTLPIN